MNKLLNSLTVLRKLAANYLIFTLTEYAEAAYKDAEKRNDFLSAIYSVGAEENLLSYVQTTVLKDINAFSATCAAGKKPSKYLSAAFDKDVKTIIDCIDKLPADEEFDKGNSITVFGKIKDNRYSSVLSSFYSINGYGQFIYGKAYKYTDGKLKPIDITDDIKLTDLKNYAEEKKIIKNNVLDFLNGLPFANMLLYGDRGTGKSSTIHAILNEYAEKGLRLIEIDRDRLGCITEIKQEIAALPLKFIIFIDDLSLEENDKNASALRAAVEGSVAGSGNAMIVATSNRRHIVKENSSERDNSVFLSDVIEEQLSLSDRFGLTVMFSTTDKESYLSIISQLAEDYKLKTPTDELSRLAERWAIIKGGRSPRKAKQFVQLAYSCEKSNRPIEF